MTTSDAQKWADYEERKRKAEEDSFRRAQERYAAEAESDRKFGRYLFWGLIAYLVIGLTMCESDNPYGEGCYDADPTQWVDVYCEGE